MVWNLQVTERYGISIFKSEFIFASRPAPKDFCEHKEQSDPIICIYRTVLALKQNKNKEKISLAQNTVMFNSKQDTEVQAPVF